MSKTIYQSASLIFAALVLAAVAIAIQDTLIAIFAILAAVVGNVLAWIPDNKGDDNEPSSM